MLLDIVILPHARLRKRIGDKVKQATEGLSYLFIVDNNKLIPHLSLFHLRSNKFNLKKIEKEIEDLISQYHSTIVKSLGYEVKDKNTGFKVSNNDTLKSLNKIIVKRLKKYSVGEMPWTPDRPPSSVEKKLRRQFGTQHNVMGRFNPHLTMAIFTTQGDAHKACEAMNKIKFQFQTDTIALCEVNYRHQVTKVIRRFKLNSARHPGFDSESSSKPISGSPARHAVKAGGRIGVRDGITEAIKVLKSGGVVVYPTDTAYGLAVDATNANAVKKLYQLKGRDFKKPIHLIAPQKHYNTVVYDSAQARELMKKYWPGALTIVLPLKARGKSWQLLSAGTGTIGLRLPNHKTALDLVNKFGKPITTTSANLAGKKTPYSTQEVLQQFRKSKFKPDYYIDGGKLKQKKPSTIISIINNRIKVIRQGPIKIKI